MLVAASKEKLRQGDALAGGPQACLANLLLGKRAIRNDGQAHLYFPGTPCETNRRVEGHTTLPGPGRNIFVDRWAINRRKNPGTCGRARRILAMWGRNRSSSGFRSRPSCDRGMAGKKRTSRCVPAVRECVNGGAKV